MTNNYQVQLVKMKNGFFIPSIGYGTNLGNKSHNAFNTTLLTLIENMCRFIDSDDGGNECEQVIGETLAQVYGELKLKREDFFLSARVKKTHHAADKVKESLLETLVNMRTNYVDLYSLNPMGFESDDSFSNIHYVETYKAIEELAKEGLVKSIGLIDFNQKQIELILKNCQIKPTTIMIEVNPYFRNDKLVKFCANNNILVIACGIFAALEKENPLFENEVIVKLAAKYNKFPAQISLRWALQRGMCVIPCTLTSSYAILNMRLLDFELSDDEMEQIKKLNKNKRLYTCENLKEHPYYPFKDDFQ